MLPINPLPQTNYFYFACLPVSLYIYILEFFLKTKQQKNNNSPWKSEQMSCIWKPP